MLRRLRLGGWVMWSWIPIFLLTACVAPISSVPVDTAGAEEITAVGTLTETDPSEVIVIVFEDVEDWDTVVNAVLPGVSSIESMTNTVVEDISVKTLSFDALVSPPQVDDAGAAAINLLSSAFYPPLVTFDERGQPIVESMELQVYPDESYVDFTMPPDLLSAGLTAEEVADLLNAQTAFQNPIGLWPWPRPWPTPGPGTPIPTPCPQPKKEAAFEALDDGRTIRAQPGTNNLGNVLANLGAYVAPYPFPNTINDVENSLIPPLENVSIELLPENQTTIIAATAYNEGVPVQQFLFTNQDPTPGDFGNVRTIHVYPTDQSYADSAKQIAGWCPECGPQDPPGAPPCMVAPTP